LTKATLSSQRAPFIKEDVVTSEPAVAEEAAALARVSRNCNDDDDDDNNELHRK
jgi:hypothetical protein